MNGELLLHMAMPLVAAVLVALALLPFRRRAGLGRALRPLLVVIAAANLALVAYLWARQVGFPLNLDLMEGTVLQHVQRAAAGVPIYPAPSPDFVALAYNPLYYELGAAVGSLTGVSLPMLRLLSMLAATLSALVIFVVVREKTGGVWWAFVAAGLFAAAYDVMECYFATAHSDAWFLAAALLGTLVLDRTRSRIGSMAGIALLVASFWFKQHGALFVIGGLGYLSLRDGLRSWPAWAVVAVLGPGIYLLVGPSLFGPYFHYFTWEVPRQWGTELRLRSMLRFAGFVALFYPVLAASSLASLARHWRRPDAWRVQLVYAIVSGAMGAMDRGSAENVFIAMGTFFILVGTIGLSEWGRTAAASPMPQIALLLAFITLAYDPRSVIPSPRAAEAYADLVGSLRRLGGPVFGPWQGQLPSGFVLEPAAHWVALEDLVRGPGRDPAHSPVVRRLTAPALRHAGPAFILANQPLETHAVLAFLTDDYVLACDLGDRFAALRVLPKRYDHGWPRYLYRDRREPFDVAALRRLCATS
jgi:hypothetical protein